MLKIQEDDQRSKRLMKQKADLLEARRQARDDAVRSKETMQKKFELMQTKGNMDVSLRVSFNVKRGPANTTKKALLPYFISVTDQKKNILYREKFLMSGMFIGNQSAMIFLGETVNLELPLTPKISSQDYIIYIGFLLNQNQFRYNQRSKLNRHLQILL